MSKKIDDKTYLNFLLQSLNVDELKQICREREIKGFSGLTKEKLIEFILDSFSEEEIKEFIKTKALEIVSKEIELALKKIEGKERETIKEIKIVNPEKHEIEINLKGFKWEVKSFLSITPDNINNPDRDCDCKIGANMGLCSHFWVGFIFSFKQGWFKLEDWTFTPLPPDFEDKIKTIKIATGPQVEGAQKAVSLIDESSEDAKVLEFLDNRVMIYEGEVSEIEEHTSEFQEHLTKFYIISLKNVKIGPQWKKKSDYDESKIKTVDKVRIRITDKSQEENNLTVGNKVSCSGGLERDNFWGILVKRVTKVTKL